MSPIAQTDKTVAEIAREYFEEAAGTRDVNKMMDYWQRGGQAHIHGIVTLTAPEGYHEWFGAAFRAIPDLGFEVLDVVAEGEKAVVRWRARGTFNGTGKFEGLSPTGDEVELEGMDLLTIRDGLIQQIVAYTNGLEIGRQMGAMPARGSTGERVMLGAANARTAVARRLKRRR